MGYSWRTPGAGRQSQTVGEEEVWNNEKYGKQRGLKMFKDIINHTNKFNTLILLGFFYSVMSPMRHF